MGERTIGAFLSLVPARWSARHADAVRQRDRGSLACWYANPPILVMLALASKGEVYGAPAAVAQAARDRGVVEDVGRSEGEYDTAIERRGWENQFVTQRL